MAFKKAIPDYKNVEELESNVISWNFRCVFAK